MTPPTPEDWRGISSQERYLQHRPAGAPDAYSSGLHDEISAGILSEELPFNPEFMIRMFLGTPGGQEFWKQFRPGYSNDFREYVDRVLAEQHAE